MRVLITGASGFIGRHLAAAAPEGWEVVAGHRAHAPPDSARAVRCDLTDGSAVAAALGGERFDVVFHCAARVDIPGSLRDPAADLADNAVATLNVARHVDCDHLVHLSTGAVYEGQRGTVDQAVALAPSLPYAAHKLLAELYARAAHERFGTAERVTIVRFFGAYGPFEPPHKIYTRLARAFALEGRREFEVFGDGTNLIDAMWVGDAVEALLAVARTERPEPVETFDLAAGDPLPIAELVRRAGRALGAGEVEVRCEGRAPEHNDFLADPRPFAAAFGVRAATPLEAGLPRLADALRADGR